MKNFKNSNVALPVITVVFGFLLIFVLIGNIMLTADINPYRINGVFPQNPSYIAYIDVCPLCGSSRECEYSYSTKLGQATCDVCEYTIEIK